MRTKSPISGWIPSGLRSDVDLMSRIKRRDPAALGELYDRCGKLAYSIVLRIVPERRVAEELVAQTFVTVWNQIARWKDSRIEDLRLWVLLLARDNAMEYLRSRNEPLPKALPRPTALTQPTLLQDFPRPRLNDEIIWLRDAVANLTDKEARMLEMAAFDGTTAAEIAVSIGESVNSVREALSVALEKLAVEED